MSPTYRFGMSRAYPGRRGAPLKGRLTVSPAQALPRSPERERALRAALVALYREFLEEGGLDVVRRGWSPGQPSEDATERKAA